MENAPLLSVVAFPRRSENTKSLSRARTSNPGTGFLLSASRMTPERTNSTASSLHRSHWVSTVTNAIRHQPILHSYSKELNASRTRSHRAIGHCSPGGILWAMFQEQLGSTAVSGTDRVHLPEACLLGCRHVTDNILEPDTSTEGQTSLFSTVFLKLLCFGCSRGPPVFEPEVVR